MLQNQDERALRAGVKIVKEGHDYFFVSWPLIKVFVDGSRSKLVIPTLASRMMGFDQTILIFETSCLKRLLGNGKSYNPLHLFFYRIPVNFENEESLTGILYIPKWRDGLSGLVEGK